MTISMEASVAHRIVAVIESFMLRQNVDVDKFDAVGRQLMLSTIMKAVEASRHLELILPAFPMKSPSLDKVLGPLPCRAELIVLQRLNDLIMQINIIYEHGVTLLIVSDGIVYGDILDVDAETRRAYGAAVRKMASTLDGLKFCSITELMSDRKLSGAFTVEELLTFAPAGESVEYLIHNDANTVRTYRGFIKFLEVDVAKVVLDGVHETRSAHKRRLKAIARQMIHRGRCLSHLIAISRPDALRMSIHGHDNSGPKFALQLFSAGHCRALTPWHNVVCEMSDGALEIMHKRKALHLSLTVVHAHDGRPHYMRQFLGLPADVKVQLLDSCGLMIIALTDLSVVSLEPTLLRQLAQEFGVIALRGFNDVSIDDFRGVAHSIGSVCSWMFGDVLVVKERAENTLNNVLTCEAMPFHYDGMFKLKQADDGQIVSDVPLF